MNLTRIRYFTEAARCGSFSEAARRLYTAQPNISKQIAQLEQELGFPLFERNKRSIQLTTAGQLLYDNMKDLPDQLDQLFEKARQLARKEETRLDIGILEGQEVSSLLLSRLNQAQTMYPNLELELERNSFSNLRNGLKNRRYDLIVTLDFDVEEEQEFRTVPVCPQPPAIAIHRNHPLAQEPELTISRLKGENFVVISPEESPVGYNRLIRQCQQSGFTPHIVREPRSLESLILCVEMGVGVALLDQNTRLSHDSAVRTIPIPDADMYVVAASIFKDHRPMLQNVMKVLQGVK